MGQGAEPVPGFQGPPLLFLPFPPDKKTLQEAATRYFLRRASIFVSHRGLPESPFFLVTVNPLVALPVVESASSRSIPFLLILSNLSSHSFVEFSNAAPSFIPPLHAALPARYSSAPTSPINTLSHLRSVDGATI